MAVLYLISVITLWVGIVLIRKSEKKQNLAVWAICSAMLALGVQVLCGGIIGKLGIPISCTSIGITNLLASAGLGLWITKKGRQAYEIKALDIVSVAALVGMTLIFGLKKYGTSLDLPAFISVDSAAHCHMARTVAIEHRLPTNLYFTSMTTGLLMQAYHEVTGCAWFDVYKVYMFTEIVYTTLSAWLFWALLRERCGEDKWKRFVPLAVTPFYWAGYPVYTTLYGFSYLGAATSLINLGLILLDQMWRKKTDRIITILGLNLVLYGVFVSYTLFAPTAFFGVFITIALAMRRRAGGKIRQAVTLKNAGLMLAVFLIPSVLGMMYSIGDISHAAPGGGIINEGGCYNDLYSNFILPLPFAIMGLYFVIRNRDGRSLTPTIAVHAVFMAIMLAGLMIHRVSVYYYVKNNNVLWMLVWILVTEAVWGMMERTKWAVLFPIFFYGVLFMGKYVDPVLAEANPYTLRVRVWDYVDLILVNNTNFNHVPDVNREKIGLFRYTYEHCDPDEVMDLDFHLESWWYKAITGAENIFCEGPYEGFLQELEDKNIRYIVAGYSCGGYKTFKPYLNTLEVVMENGEGKVFRIPEGSRPTLDAPPLPQPEETTDEETGE